VVVWAASPISTTPVDENRQLFRSLGAIGEVPEFGPLASGMLRELQAMVMKLAPTPHVYGLTRSG
jgi:hypothetical protein